MVGFGCKLRRCSGVTMRRFGLLVATLAALAGPAAADVLNLAPSKEPLPPEDASPPLSIWRPDAGGGLQHLQSGFVCPGDFRGYKRVDAHFYKAHGLDVSCNYLRQGQSEFTVYLTLRPGVTADQAMAEAKREFLQVRTTWHPQLVSETHPTEDGLAWAVALYADDGGQRDGIWIASLDDWILEYRATYRGDTEAQVMADATAMTAAAQATAGVELGVCAKSPSPLRTGRLITDTKATAADAMMTAILGGTTLIAAEQPGHAATTSVTWCAEQPLKVSDKPALFWRGVSADGSDAQIDRITLMTIGPPTTLTVDADPLAALVAKQAGHKPTWVARVADADQTHVYGYFTDRPPADVLAALFADMVTGKAKPLISYGAKGKSISIGMPPAK